MTCIDNEGKAVTEDNDDTDEYEAGTKVLIKDTHMEGVNTVWYWLAVLETSCESKAWNGN